jgi:nicotinamidase/pyrazinamidase
MRAIIIVDIQNDWCEGGAFSVPHASEIIPIVNQEIPKFDFVVVTQDWHPAIHGSFAINHPGSKVGDIVQLSGLPQILWPVHCVEDTKGAALHENLDISRLDHIVHKGIDAEIDSYSAFFDNGKFHGTGLATILHNHHVNKVAVVGLALDYCVKYTALDAVALGFKTYVLTDCCRAADVKPGDGDRALVEMAGKGINIIPRWVVE